MCVLFQGVAGVMVFVLLWRHEQRDSAESRLAQQACREWHFLSVSRPAESSDSRDLVLGCVPPFIITRTKQPPAAGKAGREGFGGVGGWVGTRLSVSPRFLSPCSSLLLLCLWPVSSETKKPDSLGSLIVFVPVSRQMEFGLVQKKIPELIWSYCPKEWPGLKRWWLENNSGAPVILLESWPDSAVCVKSHKPNGQSISFQIASINKVNNLDWIINYGCTIISSLPG